MQPGKGYSIVYNGLSKNLKFPSILVDDRTATTPIGSWLRIGGTMEMSGHSDNILPRRVMALYNNFKKYYPSMNLTPPEIEKAWYGYRPVSPDGMPYIGRHKAYQNLLFAGGHAMLGVSAAAGTGKLLEEIIGSRKPSIPWRRLIRGDLNRNSCAFGARKVSRIKGLKGFKFAIFSDDFELFQRPKFITLNS